MDANSNAVFVSGATGSIGSELTRRLIQAGRRVRALVRDPAWAGKLKELNNLEIVQGDLSEPVSLCGCMDNCSLAYHCAAKLTGSDWTKYRTINVEGTRALVKEAARAGIALFVHASTIGVYGFSQAQNIGEDFPWPTNRHPYFTTKQDAERAVWEAAGAVPVTVARLGDVFGPGQRVWTIDLIEKINQRMLVPLTDADSGTFNPVYIENAIDALILMGKHPAAPGQAFNIVDGTPMPFSEYIRRLTRMAGKRTLSMPGVVMKGVAGLLMWFDLLRGREASAKPADVNYLMHKATISGQKIRAFLGWQPAIDEQLAFRMTEAWLRREGYIT